MKDMKVKGNKRSAEDWVSIAREFGEKCVEIQHDHTLSMEKKIEKQKMLGKEMSKEIQDDPNLDPKEKQGMLKSIQNYMDDWSKMKDLAKTGKAK